MSYDANSTDAVLSRILERLGQQDGKLDAIHADVKKTNGRVTQLEVWREVVKGKVAAISCLCAGIVAFASWCVEVLLR